jgi:transcriptional regulator with GAF, ATPase, and Fis domain
MARASLCAPGKARVFDHRQFDALLLELSVGFVHRAADQVDGEIEGALSRVCDFLGVDRAALWHGSHEAPDKWRLTYLYQHPDHVTIHRKPNGELVPQGGWTLQHAERPPRHGAVELTVFFPWVARMMIRDEILVVNSLDDLPGEAEHDRRSFEQFGARSLLILPLVEGGRVFGILSFSMIGERRTWTRDDIESLHLASQIFAHALARREADLVLRQREKSLEEQLREIRRLKQRLEAEVVVLRDEVAVRRSSEEILGASDAIQYVHFRIGQVAPLDTTVLIQGETGTGKNLAATAIHLRSRRRDRPMITVSCAALPGNLIESELFGRDRGAFTGADQTRLGRFEIADGTTIFLDEIGDLPLELQAKLLRVVQTGEFERLGSSKTVKVDVRIIAASNRNLDGAVREGRFRADLFYRLNVFPITMPPLRERREDVPLLIRTLVERFSRRFGKTISTIPPGLLRALQEHDWPGNVRELENVIEQAVIVSPGPVLQLAQQLSDRVSANGHAAPTRPGTTLEEVEREHISRTLAAARWRIQGKGGAADLLGINASTLRARMRKLGIRREAAAEE